MKRKTVEICGKTFNKVKAWDVKRPTFEQWYYKDIFSAYDKPSQEKINAFNHWRGWIYQVSRNCIECGMWISSRNRYTFTLTGYIEMNDKTYGFYITKTRQEIWECEY